MKPATERTQMRRRGRGAGLRGVLIERSTEVELIHNHLDEALAGNGGVALIEAPAGKGKSRLLTIAGDLAREAGMQVLGAQAAELECDFPFGVAVQLFEPRWAAAEGSELERILRGPARHAGDVLAGLGLQAGQPATQATFAAIHGFYWLCINLLLEAEEALVMRPMAILVDDVHWADRPSLRLLAYLAERIQDAPIALVVTVRAGEASSDEPALSALRAAARYTTLHPGSLSARGVSALVRCVFPKAEPAFCDACADVTSGNPFLLTELLVQLRAANWTPSASSAARLAESPPQAVTRAIVARLERLPEPAAQVARAVSVWGPGAPPESIAHLTGLSSAEVERAADALSAVHVLHPGAPLAFVHPLTAAAVSESISPLDRGDMHRRAAGLLLAAGAAPAQVAAHLLHAPPARDPEVVEILRRAARPARLSEAPDSAIRLLERAVAENPDAQPAPDLLAELAEAELAAGRPGALGRLEQALAIAPAGPLHERITLAHARALYQHGLYREAAQRLAPLLSEPGRGPQESTSMYIAAAFFVPELRQAAAIHAQALLARVGSEPASESLDALAHLAVHGSLHGAPRARVLAAARLAWSDGALLRAPSIEGMAWPMVAAAALYVGECEFGLQICDAALAFARETNSPGVFAAASACRAWLLYELGRVAEAAADAQAGLDARPDGWQRYLRSAYGVMGLCHIEMGELERAETALSIVDHPGGDEAVHLPSLLVARSHLRLAQHRLDEALADAVAAGESLTRAFGDTGPAAVPWRSAAALAHLAAGNPGQARELAAAELQVALEAELPALVVRNSRIIGRSEGGEAGLKRLAAAVDHARAHDVRLELVRALIDHGGALRRANRRSAARGPLREALELSHAGGATVLAQAASDELAASGARRARLMLTGVQSLTPSERRVADVAARGLTTRQIAESLFVTPKTVEFHLRHIYQKLDISSRAQLTALMQGPGQVDDSRSPSPPRG